MNYTTTISAEKLYAHLYDKNWVIVDCRFDLLKPDSGRQNYLKRHISGSVYAHLDHDLSSPITAQSGRHPLPDIRSFSDWLGKLGISNHRQVIAYDNAGGSMAGRLWWLLHYIGHQAVAVLDGGFGMWQTKSLPVSSGEEMHLPSQFIPALQPDMAVDAIEVERIRQDPHYVLIDARAPERFRGETEPIDTIAGHIPGAINRLHSLNLSQNGLFKSPNELRLEFDPIIGSTLPENIIVYCGSGVTSCHHILALEIAGYRGAKLYPGSWSEWIRDPQRPIAKI